MSDENKRNVLFFKADTMENLYKLLEGWQDENKKRFLSLSIQKDNDFFCCIALTNPTEVVITSADGKRCAGVSEGGYLHVIR